LEDKVGKDTESMTKISISLEEDLNHRLRAEARRLRVSVSHLVRLYIDHYVAVNGTPEMIARLAHCDHVTLKD
jgi:hypothetical protein